MTYNEWFDIARHIKTVYPKHMDFLETVSKVKEWYVYMQDYDYKQMKQAAYEHINESQYPPTIHDLRQRYMAISDVDLSVKARIKEEYMSMVRYYPVSLRDDERGKVFGEVIKAENLDMSFKIAKDIAYRVKQQVKSAEMSGKDNLPILSVCIKECANGTKNRG